jgi:5'-3' exonuclease
MINNDTGVQHYYPKDFKISTYLKRWLWLCKPMLPDIDLELLYKKYKEI